MSISPKKENNTQTEKDKENKIQELRDIIANAQETISAATQLLSAIQGTIPAEMPINHTDTPEEDEQAIYGYFDGQIMLGDDGKQYPVPANYASKSKLVEGDKLKLNITPDNKFVYKQIGPVQRNYLIGIVKKDNKGNFTIQTPEKEYQVLLAAATYFKIEEGDEVTLIIPQEKDTIWGAIENVLQKNTIQSQHSLTSADEKNNLTIDAKEDVATSPMKNNKLIENNNNTSSNTKKQKELTAIEKLEIELEKEKISQEESKNTSKENYPEKNNDGNEWTSDIEKLKQEAGISL